MLPPEDMCLADLQVAYYPGPGEEIASIRMAFWHLQHEDKLNWKTRVIESTAHLAALTAEWTPDIFVTHWHGEQTSSAKRSIPAEIARRFRKGREDFCQFDRPFLVGQVSEGDQRFAGGHYDDYGLYEVYDLVIQRPRIFDNLPRNIAVGIHNSTHPSVPLEFDVDFRVLSEQSKLR